MCKSSHDINHYIINYEQKNCLCEEHGEPYTSYCNDCKKDICMSCDEKHDEHEIKFYQKMRYNKEQLNEIVINTRKNIDKLNKLINEFKEKLEKIKKNMENFYEIIDVIQKTADSKYRNYNKLFNINFIINNNINKDIQNIINENNNNKIITKLLNFFDRRDIKNQINFNKIGEQEIHHSKNKSLVDSIQEEHKREKMDYRPNHHSMKELCDN